MNLLETHDLSVTRGTRPVLRAISLCVATGECVGLLGPNGAGKTTFLRAALGLVPASGASSLTELPHAERARAAAFLPQGREITWPMPVEAVVALGRTAHPSAARATDHAAIERALARMDLNALRQRPATRLSGGEQARVLIARALAQETPLLLADEPTAGLDPAAQIAVMEIFAELAAAGGAVVAALHDLGLAARHCTRLVLLHEGRIAADGPPSEVLTPDTLARVFGIRARLEDTPDGLIFQPLGRIAP